MGVYCVIRRQDSMLFPHHVFHENVIHLNVTFEFQKYSLYGKILEVHTEKNSRNLSTFSSFMAKMQTVNLEVMETF